jgi:hypothetical protein
MAANNQSLEIIGAIQLYREGEGKRQAELTHGAVRKRYTCIPSPIVKALGTVELSDLFERAVTGLPLTAHKCRPWGNAQCRAIVSFCAACPRTPTLC